jgi:hypothetical protein
MVLEVVTSRALSGMAGIRAITSNSTCVWGGWVGNCVGWGGGV